jgi:outer membrane protein assembly factor BamB
MQVEGSPTVGPNGAVYIGSKTDLLYSLNGSTGDILWSADLDGDVYGPAALSNDGAMVYVGSKKDRMFALHTVNGSVVWVFDTTKDIKAGAVVHPVDGTVYFGSKDKFVYALNGTTGSQIWAFSAQGDVSKYIIMLCLVYIVCCGYEYIQIFHHVCCL